MQLSATNRTFHLAICLLVLNVVDVYTTHMVLGRGGVEANPLMRVVFDQGTAAALAVKLVVCMTIATLAYFSVSPFVTRILVAMVLAYALIVSWNIGQLVLA